eukprot:6203814-Pleurochrysis_carterae.AAC.2
MVLVKQGYAAVKPNTEIGKSLNRGHTCCERETDASRGATHTHLQYGKSAQRCIAGLALSPRVHVGPARIAQDHTSEEEKAGRKLTRVGHGSCL